MADRWYGGWEFGSNAHCRAHTHTSAHGRCAPTHTHTHNCQGCGIVEFSTKAEARRAIRDMTETNLDGRNILVREVNTEGMAPNSVRRVDASNIFLLQDREAQGVGGAGGGAGAGGAGGGAGAGAAAGRGRVKAKPNSAGGKLAFGGRATAAVRLFVGNVRAAKCHG